ncbi:MAG TPA: peptide ABC transporter ATP-binding protein, partial [Clostridiales bacterium]|nr:peptide ABC transporter ATP-binding protein [Clostridiales bacterium]
MSENEKKVLLSIKDLEVKFRVRGRILTAIRGISLDIYENEAIAIVGESGSGKSVFTKTFAGMLDSNGFISNGSIVFDDEDLAETKVKTDNFIKGWIKNIARKLDGYSALESGADIMKEMLALKSEKRIKSTFDPSEKEDYEDKLNDLYFKRTELFNQKQTFDPKKEKDKIRDAANKIRAYDREIAALKEDIKNKLSEHKKAVRADEEYNSAFDAKMSDLKAKYEKAIQTEISEETKKRNEILAKEIYLSVGRYGFFKRIQLINKLVKEFKKAFELGVNINDENTRNGIFDNVAFRVRFESEDETTLYGRNIINLAKVRYSKDWSQIRGAKIATVFQDPMTSLNPIITIGKQISSIIMKHQKCSETEARSRAITLMKKVGIPNAENRFDDYPFQYSGGMRQRIVIAIALSCQPKILICDEPTT